MKTGLRLLIISSFFLGGLLMTNFAQGQKLQLLPFDNNSGASTTHDHSEKCGHTVLESMMEKEMGYFGTKDFFEDWINQKIEARKNSPAPFRIQEDVRKIPVVVHVIHTGSPVGTGTNVPDTQIFEQIRILNEDFRRLNGDAALTPAEFLPVAADANIEFVLAKQDPNGLPTNGIVRIQGPNSLYSPDDASLIGQTSQWNPEEYLNLYVVPLISPYIGYASFPVSDLPGLNFSPVPVITDGVTIDYRYFGIGGSAVSASRGRTATHEVGHYFGLRHIWGDGGCGVDDFVTDTPEQDNSNTICNSNPSRFSCGSNDMIQNFMDYTPDACMNLFTKGQVERFNVVLANSPRRLTLVNNRATQDPELVDRDLAIIKIVEPASAICDLTVTPTIDIANAGEFTITSGQIEFRRNGSLVESKRFTLNLSTGQITQVSFNPLTVPSSGSNEFEFTVVQVNDLSDQNAANNTKKSNPIIQGEINLPYSYNLSAFPGDWIVQNTDGGMTWEKTSVNLSGQNTEAIFLRNYEYDAPGELDYFTSPSIDLTKYPNAQLVFELAHAPYNQSGFQDELIVAVSQDCGSNFNLAEASYQKSGTSLSTSPSTLDEFIPTSASQFRLELVNLAKYKDLGKIRIALINKNSFGNNIYIKNIRILPTEEYKYEVKITDVLVPSPISNGLHDEEEILVQNTGNLEVNGFLFTRTSNSNAPQTFVASGASIVPGEETILTLGNSSIDGKNRHLYQLRNPNFDQNASSYPVFRHYSVVNTNRIEVPWRQNFNNSTDLSPWSSINPEEDAASWSITPISSGTSVNNLARMGPGTNGFSYWLGSPLFDLSVSRQASIFFDIAAGQVNPETTLRMLASSDGGVTYQEVWMAKGPAISTVGVGEANPNSAGDFARRYVNLSDYAGSGQTNVRLAFVLETAGTDNTPIFLDNLELFLSANPDPVIPVEGGALVYPNPATEYFNITFNLPRREDVSIQIISSSGMVIQHILYPGTLNQTYTFSRELFAAGVYIVKINSESVQEIKRLIIH